MYSKSYATPLHLKLKSSRIFNCLNLGLHALALSAVFYAELAWWLNLLAGVFVGFSVVCLQRRAQKTTELTWHEENRWTYQARHQPVCSARLLPDSVCYPRGAFLRFKLDSQRWPVSLVIFSDSLDADSFRKLRVRLLIDNPYRASEEVQSADPATKISTQSFGN